MQERVTLCEIYSPYIHQSKDVGHFTLFVTHIRVNHCVVGNPILSLWEGFFPLFLFLSTFTYFNYRKALDYAHSRNPISAITQSRTGSR